VALGDRLHRHEPILWRLPNVAFAPAIAEADEKQHGFTGGAASERSIQKKRSGAAFTPPHFSVGLGRKRLAGSATGSAGAMHQVAAPGRSAKALHR